MVVWQPLAVTSAEIISRNQTAAVAYPLLLAGNKCLKAWRHSESQLINERRLILTVDLHFDAGFKRRLIWRRREVIQIWCRVIVYTLWHYKFRILFLMTDVPEKISESDLPWRFTDSVLTTDSIWLRNCARYMIVYTDSSYIISFVLHIIQENPSWAMPTLISSLLQYESTDAEVTEATFCLNALTVCIWIKMYSFFINIYTTALLNVWFW